MPIIGKIQYGKEEGVTLRRGGFSMPRIGKGI